MAARGRFPYRGGFLEPDMDTPMATNPSRIAGRTPPPAAARVRESSAEPAHGMTPVAGAKIQLLRRLEASGSCEAVFLAEDLLQARTLKDLAQLAHEIATKLQEVDGPRCADAFWNEAKQILLRWRDLALNAPRGR